LREGYVRDRIGIVGSIIIDDDVRTRQGAKREGLNELARVTGHGYPNVTTGALEATKHFDRLVGSDSTGDPERDPVFAFNLFAGHVKSKCNIAEWCAQ
jgi:hypothetical protein